MKEIETQFADGNRYMDRQDGSYLTCWVDSTRPPQRARLAIIRRTDLPEVERGGLLSPLSIAADAGLAERVHLMFFPDNIVGADFNWYGPRPSSFASFHNRMLPRSFRRIDMEPLLAPDVAQRLARLRDLKLFELKVSRSFADEVRGLNGSLADLLVGLADLGGAQTVSVSLSPTPYSRTERLSAGVKALARGILRRPDLLDEALQLRVRGWDPETESNEELDLLKTQILTTKRIVRVDDRRRTLDRDSAYGAIREAYGELKSDLETAASVAPSRA